MLKRLLEACLLPPFLPILLMLLGVAVGWRKKRLGRLLRVLGFLVLWAAATPYLAGSLLRSLQTSPPLPATGELPAADAIVILSAEADRDGTEYGGPVVGPMTMQRCRYGAFLARRTQLPVLCSGGKPTDEAEPLGVLMQRALASEFQVPVKWTEDRSADTWENAQFSATILKAAGVKRVLLVTSAWHLPRAVAAFTAQGLEVVPAGTGYRGAAWDGPMSLLPRWSALQDTAHALHEWLGRLAYLAKG